MVTTELALKPGITIKFRDGEKYHVTEKLAKIDVDYKRRVVTVTPMQLKGRVRVVELPFESCAYWAVPAKPERKPVKDSDNVSKCAASRSTSTG